MSLENLWQLDTIDLSTPEQQQITSVLQRIATGPQLSKDISQQEAEITTKAILQKKIDPIRAALFFIALRLKRESPEENRGILSAVKSSATISKTKLDKLVDIADPYNGYNRTLTVSPFLAPLLAACGVSCVSHGVNTCSPKFGVTHKQVLSAAGVDTGLSPEQAVTKLESLGWAYIDQAQFCPQLHDLMDLRSIIIKRSSLTTVEVLVGPIRANKTYLVTGYVHTAYPPVYGMLAHHSGFDEAILIRGVEGGVVPSLRQVAKVFHYKSAEDVAEFDFDPNQIDIKQTQRAIALEDSLKVPKDNAKIAKLVAKLGLEALAGKKGASYDALVFSAAIILYRIGECESFKSASVKVKKVLQSGIARELI